MELRANILRDMKICRFCLNEDEPLFSIYEKDGKQSVPCAVPLPLQIMACVSIEVFASDGMPQFICNSCRTLTQEAYNFKTVCKKSEDALKLYLSTGTLIKPEYKKQSELEVENVTSKKRKELEHVPEDNQKKAKTAEFVTLNYTASINMSDSLLPLDTHMVTKIKHDTEVEDDIQHFEEIIDENASDQGNITEEDGVVANDEDDDDNINPVLKVPQVQTDVFPCSHCDRTFPLQQLLDIHKKIHERERTFGCDVCGRKFFTKYDLGKHVQTHSDLKPFTCIACNKQFSRESLLHRHEKIHTDVPKYLCSFCDHTFLTREDLDAHVTKHKKRRPFACRLCNKSFVFKQGLERHELAHADQKPHKCNYCEASFTSPIKLTRHVTSHAGLRPYPCKLCGRTFLLSHHLTRHMRSHYAAKSALVQPVGQHKCDVCSMSFRRKDSLINHSAIHSMVNLKCVICNTEFDNAKAVKDHITSHLSGLAYPCDRCDYSFETQDQLEEHELKHAEMEYEDQIEKEVSLEVQQQQSLEDDEDEEYFSGDEDDDDVTEYTITNPDNPEVVRRSKRSSRIKNYAQFLKDELGSDLEDELIEPEEAPEEEHDTIKPVVRSEGTKMYSRRTPPEQYKPVPIIKPPPQEQINQPQITTLENLGLSRQAINALPNKKYVEMKIGDKTIRIQKLIMSKPEIEAMAREGKIEMKGSTILLNKGKTVLPENKTAETVQMAVPVSKPISLTTIIDDAETVKPKPLLKKTYVRKPAMSSPIKDTNEVKNENSESLTSDSKQITISESSA